MQHTSNCMDMIDCISLCPGSPEAPVATAFTLAFLSQLLHQCITSMEYDKKTTPSKLTNGKKNDDSHKHEKLEKARKLKKTMKMRRRRRKRSDLSLDSCSLSDSDTIELDSGDESDLSEGGLDDLDSEGEDSDDVYVESESDEETKQPNHVTKSLFVKKESSCNGSSLTEAGKLLTQQIIKDNLVIKNGVSLGKTMHLDTSDVSDVETGKLMTMHTLGLSRFLMTEKLTAQTPSRQGKAQQRILKHHSCGKACTWH